MCLDIRVSYLDRLEGCEAVAVSISLRSADEASDQCRRRSGDRTIGTPGPALAMVQMIWYSMDIISVTNDIIIDILLKPTNLFKFQKPFAN